MAVFLQQERAFSVRVEQIYIKKRGQIFSSESEIVLVLEILNYCGAQFLFHTTVITTANTNHRN